MLLTCDHKIAPKTNKARPFRSINTGGMDRVQHIERLTTKRNDAAFIKADV